MQRRKNNDSEATASIPRSLSVAESNAGASGARSDKEFDETTRCPVCYDTYNLTNSIPRLFSCSHTICDKCLVELIGNRKTLVCPQCRKKHHVQSGVNSFPQNRYILKHLEAKEESFAFELCKEHKTRELNLNCTDDGCKKDICQVCHVEKHKFHTVVDIVQEENKKATKLFDSIEENISQCTGRLLAAKKELRNKSTESLTKLRNIRDKYVKMFDYAIFQITGSLSIEEKKIDDQLDVVKTQLAIFNDIKNKVEMETKDKGIRKRAEITGEIDSTIKELMTGPRTSKFFECPNLTACEENLKQCCPKLVEKTIAEHQLQQLLNTFPTQEFSRIRVLTDRSIVITECSTGKDTGKLTKYSIGGTKLASVDIPAYPRDVIEIIEDGKQRLAVSYRDLKEIHIYSGKNLGHKAKRSTKANCAPMRMCRYTPESFVFENRDGHISSLETIGNVGSVNYVCLKMSVANDFFTDVCRVDFKDKPLIVTSSFHGVLSAWDVGEGWLKWTAKSSKADHSKPMCARGVATDGRSHLFVLDINNKCIDLFNVEGHYVKTLVKSGDFGLKTLRRVRWSECNSSLVVAHRENENHFISVIKVAI